MLDTISAVAPSRAAPDLPTGGGEMGERLRSHDWSATSLGSARDWPGTLRGMLRVLLASREPMWLGWGPELVVFYNDACAALLGERHPAAFGAPAAFGWRELLARAGSVADAALMRQEAGTAGPFPFVVERDGRPVQASYLAAFTPMPADHGGGGVLCTLIDVTRECEGERQMALLARAGQPTVREEAHAAMQGEALAERVTSLTMLHELALRLGGLSELEPALRAILETAVTAQEADKGLVWLHDPRTNALVAHVSHGFSAEALVPFDRVHPGPEGGGAGNAFASRRRWVIEDIDRDAGFAPWREAAHAAGFRALHSTPIVTRQGRLLGVISVHYARPARPSQRAMQMADVCARHAADAIEAWRGQQALRRSERLYRAMGESLDFGVWITTAEGRSTYVSESLLRLLGATHEQWRGEGWKDFVHPDDVSALTQRWEHCLRTGEQLDVEYRVRRADGAWHSVLSRGVPVRDDRGAITEWAGINLDIRRLKQVEHELRELDQRKNEFLATLAHELRNPLAPLRNGLEVLRLAGGNEKMATQARGMMERQLGQMVRLVDDLLDVSRVSRGKIELRREVVPLASLLRNAIETSQPLIAERGHDFVVSLPTPDLVLNGDATRLAQVFSNLLNNAAKYTEPGGRVELYAAMRDGGAAVTVRDNGVGIPPDMLSRVFDIFTQVDRELDKAQGGLGIGLSIAKRLVEMHGGRIEVASGGDRQGSAFTVWLPARLAEEPPGCASGAHLPLPASCRRVLVADDNEDSATTLSMILEVMGHDVRTAHDGEEAVRIAREFRPEAVLLDIGMPRMNGYDACRALRLEPACSGATIVALTGWGQAQDREHARVAGFDRHLVKPVEPRMLEELIAALPPGKR